jgi:predicted permease
MTLLARLRSFLRAALRRSRMEHEMDAELRFHLDARTDDLVARGLTRADARRRARAEFGDPIRWKEQGREARGLRVVDGLQADLKYGVRWLLRSPGLAVTAVLSMAIGIGANVAIFSAVNTILLNRLPVADPAALVLLAQAAGDGPAGEIQGTTFPYPFYRLLRDSDEVLSGVLAAAHMSPSLDAGGPPERVNGELVSGNYFDVLGVQPHVGRHFTQDDEAAGANRVVVLGYGCWLRRFGGEPSVIGRVIRLNGLPMTIVGVSPRSFQGLEVGGGAELRVPITLQAEMHGERSRLERRGHWWLQIMGRLKLGVTRAQASVVLDREYRAYRATLPRSEDAIEQLAVLDGSRGDPSLGQRFTLPLMVLMGLVAMVLALVCVNVGNLLLARAAARHVEMSLRLAMGAGRLRVMRQLLVETLLLGSVAGVLGLVASRLGVRVLAQLAGAPPEFEFALDTRVLTFAATAVGITALVCGLPPAWASTRVDILRALRVETSQYTPGRMAARRMLIAGQIALSLALLVGAGLFARTLFNLRHAGFGFDPAPLAVVTLNPVLAGYDAHRLPGFYAGVLERVSSLPAVESAAFAAIPLLSGGFWGSGLTLDTGGRHDDMGPFRNAVGPGYFGTIGIPLREGREFTSTDSATSQPVAIVNEAFVRRYLGNGSALGRRIGPAGPRGGPRFTIVGVVADSKGARVREELWPFWYVPHSQLEAPDGQIEAAAELALHVRARGSPTAALHDIRQAVASIDSRVAIGGGATLKAQIEDQVETERLLATLAGVFAAMALLLAALGLYSAVSYMTASRTREIGIRMALGASPPAILRLMCATNAPTIAAGAVAGVAISLLAAERLRPLLFELEPADPATLLAATAAVTFATAAAVLAPARRAARIDPAATLR